MNKFLCGRLSKKGNLVRNSGCGELEFVVFDGYHFNEQELTGFKFKLDKQVNVTCEELEDSYDIDENQYHAFMTDAKNCAFARLSQRLDFECPDCGRVYDDRRVCIGKEDIEKEVN